MRVTIHVGDEDIVLTESNCNVYRFSERPECDHVYYQTADRQFYLFGSGQLMAVLEAAGATYILAEDPEPCDVAAFDEYLAQCMDDVFIGHGDE